MQTSNTRLKKPLYLWLARIVTLAVILASIGVGVSRLPEILERLKHEGATDVYWVRDQNGEAIIHYITPTAVQNGVAIGDKILNYEDEPGRLGTPVIFHIQRESSPARDFTFLRGRPSNDVVFGAIQLGLPFDVSVALAFLFISLIPLMIGAVGSLLLYWLRSNDWMALLTATVLAFFAIPSFPSTNLVITIFSQFTGLILFFWFILFPNGKLMPRWSWIILLLFLPSRVYRGESAILLVLDWIAGLAIIGHMYFRYRYTFSPVERQQSKWVIMTLIIGLIPLIITDVIYRTYWYTDQVETSAVAYFFQFFAGTVLTVLLALGIFFSIFRYRLWDVDTFISRAIVYGSLTGILGLVGFAVIPLINYALTQALGNQSGMLAVLVSAFPIAALYNPVHERLQQWVEKRFKPEEMDFENTFIEFTSELRSLFTVNELSTLLAHHAVEQLDIAHASVFLNGKNGQLKHVTTIHSAQETSEPNLDDKIMEKIKKGQLASPDDNYAQSLVIPLVVPRSRKPSLLGALFLGPRLRGVGYSTPMVKSLKKFGEEVGKAFYVAEIKSNQKQTLLEAE